MKMWLKKMDIIWRLLVTAGLVVFSAGVPAVPAVAAAGPAVYRDLPIDPLVPGQQFDVTVTFTAPCDNFNAVGLSDFAPEGWNVTVDSSWGTPAAFDALATGSRADYIWDGPYTYGESFTVVYQVTVPIDAAPGPYLFGTSPGDVPLDARLEYFENGSPIPQMLPVIGMTDVTVAANTVTRLLPAEEMTPGEQFDVMIKFSSPVDQFNAVGLSDFAPAGWNVTVDSSWCTPAAFDSLVTGNRADYLWDGPYPLDEPFIAVYQVTVPADAVPGTYTFGSGTGTTPNGQLEYYTEGTAVPSCIPVTGHSQVTVKEGLTPATIDVLRNLPLDPLVPGQQFDVTVTFTAPFDAFNAVGLSDFVPEGWTVAGSTSLCSPAAMSQKITENNIEYIWDGPFTSGTAFTAVYTVTVPADAGETLYTFGIGTSENPSAYLRYYDAVESYVSPVTGDVDVAVVSGTPPMPTVTINPVITPTGSSVQTINGTFTGLGVVITLESTMATFGDVTYPLPCTWSAVANLMPGFNDIIAVATDTASQVVYSDPVDIFHDNLPPSITIYLDSAFVFGGEAAYYNTVPVLYDVEFYDDFGFGSGEYRVNDSEWIPLFPDRGLSPVNYVNIGEFTVPGFGEMNEGLNTVTFRAFDAAGNEATADFIFYKDMMPPTDPTEVISTTHQVGVVSNNPYVTIIWADAEDTLSGLAGYSVLWDNASSTVPPAVMNVYAGELYYTNPEPLADGTDHWFHIRSVDNVGNWVSTVHIGPFVIDTDAPSVIEVTPSDGTLDALIDTTVTVVFNEPMNADTAEAAFSMVDDNGAPVAGTFAWFKDATEMVFTPSSQMEWSTAYLVTVDVTAADIAGNWLDNSPYPFSFTTKTVLERVSIHPDVQDLVIPLGSVSEIQYYAVGVYSDGTEVDLTGDLSPYSTTDWFSTDTDVATVETPVRTAVAVVPGKVTLHGVGKTAIGVTVVVTDTGEPRTLTAGTMLIVGSPVLTGIVITEIPADVNIPANDVDTTTLAVGETTSYAVKGVYSDGSVTNLPNTANLVWTSNADAIASIDSTGFAVANGEGVTTITATLDGKFTDDTELNVTAPVIQMLEIQPFDASVPAGKTLQYTALAYLSDGSMQNVTDAVAWTSGDESIAIIDAAGLATGLLENTATTVFAVFDTGAGIVQADTTIKVIAPVIERIEFVEFEAQVAAGVSVQLHLNGVQSDGSYVDLTVDPGVIWYVSNTNATLRDTGVPGLVKGVKPGTAGVTASYMGMKATVILTVAEAELQQIDVFPANAEIPAGSSVSYMAWGTYSDGSGYDITSQVTWESDNPDIASIDSLTGLAFTETVGGPVTITAASGAIAGTTTLTVTDAELLSIRVDPAAAVVNKGESVQFRAFGTYSDMSEKDITGLVIWSAGTGAVIDAAGKATGTAVGTDITVTAALDGPKGTALLTVNPAVVVSISLSPVNASVANGLTQAYTVTGTYSDGTKGVLTTGIVWSKTPGTGDATVAGGIATGTKVGNVIITAEHATGGIANAVLTVTKAVVLSVTVTPTDAASIAAGTTKDYTAVVTTSDGSLRTDIVWVSSNVAVASVDSTGQATGHTTGTTQLSATCGGVSSNKVTLTVTPAVLATIEVTPLNPTIALGTSRQFRSVGTYTDGSKKDITGLVVWVSSDTAKADISASGLVTTVGKNVGTTDITALLSGKTGTSVLTVSDAALVSLGITSDVPSVAAGKQMQLTATGTFTAGPDRDISRQVTWTSGNPVVARVNGAGTVTSFVKGTTVITAVFSNADGSEIRNTFSVVVTDSVLETITVTPDNAGVTFVAGNAPTVQYKATGVYSDGHTEDLTNSVTWTSSAAAVATVSGTGLATTLGTVGTTSISAAHASSGKSDITNLTVNPDVVAPVVKVANPPDGLVSQNKNLTVSGTVDDRNAVVTVVVNKRAPAAATVDANGDFTLSVVLDNGNNTIVVYGRDGAGNIGTSGKRDVLVNPNKPNVTITSPKDGLLTRNSAVTITGTATHTNKVTVRVNGTARVVNTKADGTFSLAAVLTEGKNIITATAFAFDHDLDEDYKGTTGTRTVTLDTTAPSITITEPTPDAVVSSSGIVIIGTVDDPGVTMVLLMLNDQPAVVVPVSNGTFLQHSTLVPGENNFIVVASDRIGNSGTSGMMFVTLDTAKPAVRIDSPVHKLVTNVGGQAVTGTVDDPTITEATLKVNGVPQTISVVPSADGLTGIFSETVALLNGINTLEVIASDGATPPNIGTSGEITVTVDVTAPELTLGLSEPSDSISIMVTSDEALKQIPDVSVTGTRLSDNASIGPAAVTLVRIGVNTWVGTYGSDTETIVNGDYTVTITGEDKAGNKTNRTATFSKKSVTTDGESASVVQDAGTVLEIETNGAVTSDITVTQHMENPSGNVGNPEGADTPAAFVEINASAELRNNLKQIYIEVSYNPSELPAGTDESTLKLYLWDVSEGIWKAVPGSGVDTLRKVVFGTINHLSKYGAFGSIGTTPPAPPSTPSAPSGGGIPAVTTTTVAVEGLTASVPLRINAVGIVEDTTDLSTSDEKASLIIDSGTTVLGSDGKPLTTLTAEALTEPPAPPTGSSIIAAYDFGPDGATFEPAINLVMPYDPSSLPEGTDEAGLMIAWWNGSGWEMLETVVDTVAKTVSAPVSHFTTFALIVPPAPVEDEPVIEEEPVIEDEEPVIEDEPVIDEETPVIEDDKPAVDEETPVEEPTAGIAWWVWMIIALAVIGAVTAVWTFWLKPRLT